MEAIFPPLGACQPVAAALAPVLPPRRLAKLLRPAPLSLSAHEYLFVEGDVARQAFVVESGAVMVLRGLPDGRRQILDIAGPGRIVGLAGESRHDCSAIALQPSTARALESSPSADVMLAEIHRLRDLATLLGRKTAQERLASFLLEMMGEAFDLSKRLDFPVNRQEIADYLGLALETVCRNFVALRKRGLIAPASRESVFIRDVAGLRRIASGAQAAA